MSLANAEDSDLKRVLDKAGSAPQVWFFNEDRRGIKRCQGYGIAFGGYDAVAEEIPASFVLLFSSPQAAERAADEYDEVATFVEERRFEGGNIAIADIAIAGEFVVGSGKYAKPAVVAPAAPTAAPPALWHRMPDYLSVRAHRLYVTDGPPLSPLDPGNLPASLGESPEAVSLDSVNRLVWTIVFDNADPGERFRFSVYGGLVCFDWSGNEQFYIPSDTDFSIDEAFVIQHYNISLELAQYNPGFCEWVVEDQNGGYIAGLDFELVP